MRKIEFFDDAPVRARLNVVRQVHPPRKHPGNPVLAPARPWEAPGASFCWPSALYDEEARLFKVWYETLVDGRGYGAYAVSVDGIHWERPDLGLVRWNRSTRHNLFYRGVYRRGPGLPLCPCVVKRGPGDWHLFYWDARTPAGPPGVIHYVGEDGLHWRPGRRNPVVQTPVDRTRSGGVSDVLRVSYDPVGRQFLLSQRTLPLENGDAPRTQKRVPGGLTQRRVALATSPDGERFSPLRTVLVPTLNDPADLQFYGLSPFRHGAGFLGYLLGYRPATPNMDVELAFSADAVAWRRVAPNVRYLATGPRHGPDGGLIHCACAPIRRQEKLFLYYMGTNGNHAGGTVDGRPGRSSLNLAVADADRMVSVRAPGRDGRLLVGPVRLGRGGLALNANARGGLLRAALRDAGTFAELPGFGFDAAQPVTADVRHESLAWRPTPRAARLPGRTVYVDLKMESADLFSLDVD